MIWIVFVVKNLESCILIVWGLCISVVIWMYMVLLMVVKLGIYDWLREFYIYINEYIGIYLWFLTNWS